MGANVKLIQGVGLFAVGALIGFLCANLFSDADTTTAYATREGGYEFINPLITCDIGDDLASTGLESLKTSFEETKKRLKEEGLVTRVGVYFRDMNRARWTGIDVDEPFSMASLGKVPLAIAMLRDASFSQLSSKTLYVPPSPDRNATETYKPVSPMSLGQSHSYNTLLTNLLKASDNNAMQVLLDNVSIDTYANTYFNLGISSSNGNDEEITPKSYSRVFRILYNASFISHDESQYILRTLAESEFKSGLTRGVPEGVSISHKFGERTVYVDGVPKFYELHDCGIIYYPKSPYLLCVMTEGTDFEKLSSVIQAFSIDAYDAVSRGLIK